MQHSEDKEKSSFIGKSDNKFILSLLLECNSAKLSHVKNTLIQHFFVSLHLKPYKMSRKLIIRSSIINVGKVVKVGNLEEKYFLHLTSK